MIHVFRRAAFRAALLSAFVPNIALAQPSVEASPASTPASPIVWRLKNPFRYFKKPEHFALYAEAARQHHAASAPDVILATERSLAEKTDGMGWAAGIFEHVADEACWYKPARANGNGANGNQTKGAPQAKTGATREPCGEYIKPKSHTVLLSAPTLEKAACTWTVGSILINAADCSKPVEAQIPYPDGAEVKLAKSGTPIATETIKVEDLLVVGLGDSFGAGDGNPDRPVSFRVNRPLMYDVERDGYPQRYNLTSDVRYTDARFRNKGAGWVHRGCHRSLYSHQLRTALHLAMDDPSAKRSVTYLGLACSGATMLSMFNAYNGYDDPVSSADPPHARRVAELSQIDILGHALCAPGEAKLDTEVNYNEGEFLEIGDRKIHTHVCPEAQRLRKPDLVLLSVGGNDVGFSGLVSNAALLNRYLGYVKLFSEDPRITPDNARVFMGRIPGRYASLAKALKAATAVEPSRIVLSAYPDMHEDHEGNVCASSTRGFDVGVAWRLDGGAVGATQKFMEDVFTPGMAKAATEAGWTFASAHRSNGHFKRRGICALAPEELDEPSLSNVQFPRFRDNNGTGSWAPYKPGEYRPYASRQRFFLTPNDAFMASHFHTRHIPILDGGPEVQIALWSAYSGAFHPTAQGQAAIGDAVLAEARRLLPPRQPSSP